MRMMHEEQIAELRSAHQTQLDEEEAALVTSKVHAAALLSSVRRSVGKLGGRPTINRSTDELRELEQSCATHAHLAMAQRVSSCVGMHGEEGAVAVESVMAGLSNSGYIDAIWESKEMWELRMQWVDELKETLSISWDPNLTFRFKDQLNISYDKMDQLRFGFSHHRVGKRLVSRPWVINPWTGAKQNFPQPIAPRTAWAPLVKTFISDHGLSMDNSGNIAQRRLSRVVGEQIHRDRQRGYLPAIPEDSDAAPEESEPTVTVFGADGFSAGNMSMMHVGVSSAPSYIAGLAQSNEVNLNTVATSRTDDHWGGLDTTLAGGYYSGSCESMPADCIAHEFNEMLRTGFCPPCKEGDPPEPVDPVACLDLAAARGIRGGKGKCACHVEADSSDRHKVPEVADDAAWPDVRKEMDEAFPFLPSGVMRADLHTPPADWDYSMGSWKCSRKGCSFSFASKAEWRASVAGLKAMKRDKSDGGKKALAKRAAAFAVLHPSGQAEHEPNLMEMDMDKVIVDPLHDLFLNLPKTLWKYSFGDRMANSQREAVAEYLEHIGCPLDIRAKGDGRDAARKWFTGAIFQRFVEGTRDGQEGGLKRNIESIVDIIFKQLPSDADAPADADAPTNADAPTADAPANTGAASDTPVSQPKSASAPAAKAPRARGRKRAGGFCAVGTNQPTNTPATDDAPANRAGGFCAVGTNQPTNTPATDDAPANPPADPPVPDPPAAPPAAVPADPPAESAEDASLRARYGLHMDVVRLVFKAWREFGLLYAEWKTEWPRQVDEALRHSRALALLRRAIAFSKAMAAVSYNKHKSWYVFLTVWVVPRQVADRGDLFPYSTAPIEQRGARMKRIVRSCVSWRGPVTCEEAKAKGRRPYESCAMLQLLRSVVAQEQIWQAPQVAGGGLSVSQRRLLATGRSTIVKREPLKLVRMAEEVIDLT